MILKLNWEPWTIGWADFALFRCNFENSTSSPWPKTFYFVPKRLEVLVHLFSLHCLKITEDLKTSKFAYNVFIHKTLLYK